MRGGGVCFWQWFGSSLQLTWLGSGESVVLGPPSDDDVTAVLHRVLRQSAAVQATRCTSRGVSQSRLDVVMFWLTLTKLQGLRRPAQRWRAWRTRFGPRLGT